jgi:Helix-turn-helix domain
MSQMRQPGIFDRSRDRKSAITTLARDYPAGHIIPLHFHDRDQFVYPRVASFQQEIGMTFGKWRQQLRLMQGMRLLAQGAKVTHAALECSYSSPSAFISMFRKVLGTTPSSYFR